MKDIIEGFGYTLKFLTCCGVLWLALHGIAAFAVFCRKKLLPYLVRTAPGYFQSWRTTTLGIVTILFALVVARVTYVPTNTLYFNVFYVWPPAISMLMAGIGLIHARDHKFKD